jgi:ribosomal protein S7
MKISLYKNLNKFYLIKFIFNLIKKNLIFKQLFFRKNLLSYCIILKRLILKLRYNKKKTIVFFLKKFLLNNNKINIFLLNFVKNCLIKLKKKNQIFKKNKKFNKSKPFYLSRVTKLNSNLLEANEFSSLKIFFKNSIFFKKRNFFLKNIAIFIKKNKHLNKKVYKNIKQNLNICIKKRKLKKNKNLKNSGFDLLYKKIIGFLLKKGKKSTAFKIVNKALSGVCKNLNKPIRLILLEIFNKLKVFVESKKIKIRRGTHIVPFPVNPKRRIFLIVKRLVFVIKKNKLLIPFESKLGDEIKKIIETKEKTLSHKIKIYNLSKSIKHRSNIHFRW